MHVSRVTFGVKASARANSLEEAELSAGQCEIKAGIGGGFACVTFACAAPFACAKREAMDSARQPQPPAQVAAPPVPPTVFV